MSLILVVALAYFVVASIAAEIVTRKTVAPVSSWISSYLTGPASWLEDSAFVALAGVLEFLPHTRNLGAVGTVAFSVAGIGLLATLATRKYFPAWFPSLTPKRVTQLHVLSAGVAFVGAIAGVIFSHSKPAAIVLAVTAAVCVLVYLYPDNKADRQQWVEKLGAFGICVSSLLLIL